MRRNKRVKEVVERLRPNQPSEMNRKILMKKLLGVTFDDISLIEDSALFKNPDHDNNTFRLTVKEIPRYIFVVSKDITGSAKLWARGKLLFWETHMFYITLLEMNQGDVKPAPFNVSFFEYAKLYFRCRSLLKERAKRLTLHNVQRITKVTVAEKKNGK